MNKNFYKTIFSKSRGEMIAVAENVSAEGQTATNISCKTAVKLDTLAEQKLGLSVLSFSMMLIAGTAIFVTPVMVTKANIVADPNAAGNQRPTILNSANGTTQVNIQTPSKAGVSVNHYQQFDVNQNGVILNNSRQNTQTQLGGYIQANPWLAGGEAKVIVNQVNGSNPSHLNGYVEVGGRKADVIIANPAGINVDGGGFINAGGVTLTTGKPILDQGNLKGFQIRDGLINITGQGLDTSTNDYTRLLSHAAQLNAGVWAKDLQIVTGQNDIDAKNNLSQVNTTNSNNTGNPQFAIDTGSLGGMYAGKISLISTDKGIGINNAGQIFASAGSIKISADGQLQNSGSVVAQHKEDASQATLDIQAKALNNSGSLSSLAKQSIQTNNLNNIGLIATSAELNIRNTEKMSNEGELSAGRIDIDTAELKNKSGQIVQTGLQDLAIESGVLLNSVNALIGYTEVDTSTGSGNSGGSAGDNSGNTNNGAPTTATGGGGTTSANTSITASYAQGKIKANKIENEKAQITANGGVELSTSQALENSGTLNLKKLSAQGESLKNTGVLSTSTLQSNTVNFQNINGKIYTHTAEIQASHLDNQQGTIQSQNYLKIQANQRLNNQAGQIAAQSGIDIHDGNQNTLTVDNTRAGKILSEGDIHIQSGQLLHADQSELIANQNIQLKQKEHLTVDSLIQAGHQISIENATGLTNNNLLEAGNTLNISANDIKNSQKGILQANTKVHLSANNQIENTGLINSNGLTLIEAGQKIQNLGTGQIYGDHIALQTSQLLNAEQQTAEGTKSAVIAARERLDIAAQQIENREQALLSSENQLVVGGKLNQNHLAEGVAQSLDNASARIQSAGDMYLSVNTLTNRNLHFSSSEKEVPNSRKQIIAYQGGGNSEILDASHVTGWGGQETVYLDGHRYEDYTKYDYTRYEKQDYVDSSAPAYIVSGGTLTLDGQNLSNNKSQILAAQGIKILQNDVDNIDAEGEHRVIQSGTSRYHYVGWNSTGTSKRSKWNDSKPYNPADIVTPKKLNVVKYDGSYQGVNGGVNPTQIQRVQTEAVDDKTNSEIRTITPDLSLPNQSLFGINKNNNNEPLIETNRAFTQYKNWLGSDYMLNMLSTDPANMHKRLGDGYYEQKLINDQVAQLTGKVYLDGYTNYEEQFKALMDAGVSAAKNMSLTLGVALSEAQIARLTSDIVWMVTETVTLADGQKLQVLVPKVYALVQAGDLSGQGTLIAANTISMQLAGNLNNTGTIAGRQLVNLNGNNINNIGGLIQGREVYTQAKNDINNIGGQIRADQTLFLDAGNNINSSSTTIKTENKQGSSEFTAENIGRKAGLYVTGQKGQLIVQAKKDISLQASELNSQGGVSVQAGRNLNLSTVNVSRRDLSSAGDDDYVMHASSRDVGTQIQAKNDIQLKSGGATSIQAGVINSKEGNVVIDATKGLNVTEGRETSAYALSTHEQRSNAVSSSRKDNLLEERENLAVASVISGKQIVLNSGQDITIQGSNVVSDDLTQIQAKENISITATENQYASVSESTVKKSGFTGSLSDGVASVGYGKSNIKQDNKSHATSLTQSVVGSVNGNTNIVAGGDLNAVASIIEAGKDINLMGKNVHLDAADIQQDTQSKFESKSSGMSIGFTYSGAATAVASAKKSQDSNDFSDSAVGKIMSSAETVRKATMAATTPVVFQAHNQKTIKTKDTSSTQSVGTEVKAGGHLNIIATEGDIRSQGAKISAEGDALLNAKNNIHLLASSNTETQNADTKRSGFSIDNRDHLAPIGVYNDKGKGGGSLSQSVGTELSVGGKTTLQANIGDINIVGSKVVSQDDLSMTAGKDINIQSAQSGQSQSESQKSKGWGSAQISDTERFDGYMANQNKTNSKNVTQERSQVGSLDGNVTLNAGNNYNQKVADVVAGKDLNITAKSINILDDHNTGSDSQSSKDLKIGLFSRVSSPLIDLVNAVDKAGKSKADDRTQALQGVAAVAQGYQTYSDIQGGALFKAETGIGFSTSKNSQDKSYSASQSNLLNAGGNINLTSTEGDIHLKNTQVKAKENIALDSAKDILLESGQSQQKADGKNSNAGASYGVGVSVGAQTGAYVFVEAGYGQGSNHLDGTVHENTTLNSDRLSIKSKGDTTLKGAQATANRIDADVGGKLNIISQQDTLAQDSEQTGAGIRLQASLGTAWQASGNYSNSKASGSSSSVNEQSGLFAGDGGYHVKADSVDLKGGAIASTASKENNDLTANSLTFSNLENQSGYKATTVALSGGTKLGKADGESSAPQPTSNSNWKDSLSFSPSLPQQSKDKDSSTTYATLSEGNINIGGKDTSVEALGIHSDINTANQKVNDLPDLQAVLDKQKIIADATSTIATAGRTYAQDQIKNAAAEKEALQEELKTQLSPEDQANFKNLSSKEKNDKFAGNPEYAAALAYEKSVTEKWGMGGDYSRGLNAVTTALTAVLGGQTDLQAATNTLAPYAAQVIGQQWGHGEDKNTAAQLAAHAILGATLAYINGGDPTAGGSAVVASEAAATYFTNQYKDNKDYQDANGVFQPNLLPEDIKTQIRDLTAGIGAVIGGVAGDSSYNAQLAGVIGQNAVENNVDSVKDIQNAKAYSDTMYKSTCAALGLSPSDPACGSYIRKEGLEILKGTALVFIPTEPYELIPIGKGVGVVVKGSKKLIAVYKDAKAAEKAVEKAGAKVEIPNAVNINAQDALNRKLSGLEKAQKIAEVTKTLPDGRIRYYNKEVAAAKEGQTRGASFVTEYDPKTGAVRQWMESYDHSGNVIRVHPKSINGQPVIGQHYPPTGKEIQAGAK